VNGERVAPRIAVLDPAGGRLDAPLEEAPPPLPRPRAGLLGLGLAGTGVLAVGLSGLGIADFVADQFARAAVLGWATLAVAAVGAGLIGVGVVREMRGLSRLASVDRLRRRLAAPATVRQAALDWLATLPGPDPVAAAVRAANDPDSVRALLRDGPVARLRADAEALGRRAALDVFALTAAMPAPALDAALVTWRGLRLVRQIAELHGLQPGLFGTIALVRRTLASAATVAAASLAADTVLRAALSTPLLAHLAGDAAGASVAARRMVVLGRAAAAACLPLPPGQSGDGG
jgi:putative membrane protein